MGSQSHSTVTVTYTGIRIDLAISASLISECNELIQSFSDELRSHNGNTPSIKTPIELHANFLKYCQSRNRDLSRDILRDFNDKFLCGRDIHIVCNEHGLAMDQVRTVLSGYFSVWDLLSESDKPLSPSAVFNSDSVKLMALIGGQGGSGNYIYELLFLYQAYYPLVAEFIKRTSSFLCNAISDKQLVGLYEYGLDFSEWLNNPEKIPPSEYLFSSPVSVPLSAATQLTQYLVTFKTLGITPGELARSFEVVVGHSHGIVTAATISCSDSEESFYINSEKALCVLSIIGSLAQLEHPLELPTGRNGDSNNEHNLRTPRYMISIKGLDCDQLSRLVEKFNNKFKHKHSPVNISVINTHNHIVVSGVTASIVEFSQLVHSEYPLPDQDQTQIPYSQRKPVISAEYLNITMPGHCDILSDIADEQYQYVNEKGWLLDSNDMIIPVRANDDGHDLREESNLTKYLIRSSAVLPVNWPVAIDHPGITHIIDFGTGGTRGFGVLAHRNMEGRGVSIICASAPVPGNPEFGTRADLYKDSLSSVVKTQNWADEYSPELVRTSFDGKLHISTRMSRLLGRPPIMVSGMTPTTVNEDLVAAVLNAGYHVELACGDIHTRAELEAKVNRLVESIEPGCGITFNCIYLNQSHWSFQFQTIVEMRKKGVPIEGLCIGGGVPSLETAAEIIDTIRDAGLCHVAFKPGSAETINQVVEIAKRHSNFPVILQWAGGRGGGHHSFEDFHQPILDSYRTIRKRGNIVLVAGSGFGGADDTFPYLTGEWSIRFGRAPMPFDGILLGSRMMVSKESKAADSVKELIVAAPGVADSEWERTYTGPAGGVITIRSETGEPMHIIANRCGVFWKELDSTIFSVPHKDRLKAILDKRDYIISHLNSDHTRPWFGTMPDGRVVDIEDMTYMEVATRLADLLYTKDGRGWIHPTYSALFKLFVARIEERFTSADGDQTKAVYGITGIYEQIGCLAQTYPGISSQLLLSEDAKYFIELCRRREQKPVTFIPVLDKDFEVWFKKDTLLQSENLECVPDQDPQRVLILQGPVSAQYSTEINVPAKDILDDIYTRLTAQLLDSKYNGDIGMAENLGYLSNPPLVNYTNNIPLRGVTETVSGTERAYALTEDESLLPDDNTWTCILSGGKLNWLYALLTSQSISDNMRFVGNTIRTIIRPRVNHTFRVSLIDNTPTSVEVIDEQELLKVCISINDSSIVSLSIYNHLGSGRNVLKHQFKYNPKHTVSPFSKLTEMCSKSSARFIKDCMQLGPSTDYNPPRIIIESSSVSFSDYYISSHQLIQYLKSIKQSKSVYWCSREEKYYIPVDYISALVFPSSLICATQGKYGSDFLRFSHESSITRMIPNILPLCTGDTISANTHIELAVGLELGNRIQTKTLITRDDKTVAEVISSFFIRGVHLQIRDTFSSTGRSHYRIILKAMHDILAFRSKEWFIADTETVDTVIPGSALEFYINTHYHYKSLGVYSSISITGTVMLASTNHRPIHIGDVEYIGGLSFNDPVTTYLSRLAADDSQAMCFDHGGYSLFTGSIENNKFISTFKDNTWYRDVSYDYNPIHTNEYIADYAGLPTIVTHTTNISALTKSTINCFAAGGCPERITSWNVGFIDKVMPLDRLVPSFKHIGMNDGRMLVKGTTTNQHGNTVLEFSAEVEQPPTAYVFTGQGSQCVGMGMDMYESSKAAKSVWDRGDRYMIDNYGVSILDVVRTNPIKYTVYFKGPKGAKIRDNYIGLVPGVTKHTRLYTFSSQTGLLHMTQFTQPALALFEMATIADMRTHGLIQNSAIFAGHSFGEIASLCIIGGVISLEGMLDIAFCRGTLMQQAINTDNSSNSRYGMVAVNLSRVGSSFTENDLTSTVQNILSYDKSLLELVNYNIESQQYVVAGELHQLRVLSMVLDRISEKTIVTDISIADEVGYIVNQVSEEKNNGRCVNLERGRATTPIPNVHVPFHSSLMNTIVKPFRKILQQKMKLGIDYKRLISRYIPNITGTLFDISYEYTHKVYNMTNSSALKDVLNMWDDFNLSDDKTMEQVAQILLVELVANQVACPVQWISTQNTLLRSDNLNRIIEIGPSSVLSVMAKRTARIMDIKFEVLNILTDQDVVYYRGYTLDTEIQTDDSINNSNSINSKDTIDPACHENTNTQDTPPDQSEAQPLQTTSSIPTDSVTDIPSSPLYVIRVIAAHKLKKQLCEVTDDKSINMLANGKSTLQNELEGIIKREFGTNIPDSIGDVPFTQVADKITVFSGTLGPYTTEQISRLFRSKLPSEFNQSNTHSYLESTYNIGPLRRSGVMLLALTMEPSARLANDEDARRWFDDVVSRYAEIHNISLNKINAKASLELHTIKSFTAEDLQVFENSHAGYKDLSKKIIKVLSTSTGEDLGKYNREIKDLIEKNMKLQSSFDSIVEEFGEEAVNGVKSLFSQMKARHFDSYWNWARADSLELLHNLISGKVDIDSPVVVESIGMLKNRSTPALIEFLAFCHKGYTSKYMDTSNDNTLGSFMLKIYSECSSALDSPPVYIVNSLPTRPYTTIERDGTIVYTEVQSVGMDTYNDYIGDLKAVADNGVPFIYLKGYSEYNTWEYDDLLTLQYLDVVESVYSKGISFSGKCALITGCGKGSIGEELLKGLLRGGAKVVATTSSYNRKTMVYFEDIYQRYGSRGSELVVVPFNQSSIKDIKELIRFIYSPAKKGTSSGLGWTLDLIIPFAALPGQIGDISSIGSHAELSLRTMLTNIYRLIGEVGVVIPKHHHPTHVVQVILPLSPNHGQLGGDGLYGESKIGLEALLNRWRSESWSEQISVIGAVIGWVRCTNLMDSNDNISMEIEKEGIYTFTAKEMAALILCLADESISDKYGVDPFIANLSGGLDVCACLNEIALGEKNRLATCSQLRKHIVKEGAMDIVSVFGDNWRFITDIPNITRRANYKPKLSQYKSYEELDQLHYMQGMVNLDKVVVITGFGEVGPHGSSTTRWEMEAYGEFSLEGCIELAWIMGYIKFFDGALENAKTHYIGWVDAKTGEPVADIDVKARYEKRILEHTGIRLIEPELHDGYDPSRKLFMRELQINHEMEPFEASKEEAEHFKLHNGDKVDIWKDETGAWFVRFLKDALIMVPKALQFDRAVAGQIPTGWDPVRYGIPKDIAEQVDHVTCYALVATVEALLRSGITDPYELYKYFYVGKVGSTIGSGIGGVKSMSKMYSGRYTEDSRVQGDVFQETLLNATSAWVNMLLLSSSGPIKPALGACATAILSIDIAIETIQCGKAKVVVAGGTDSFGKELSYEFAQMGASSNSKNEAACGRAPSEMSRPCTSTRSGFMESEGAGIVVLMSASAAIEMGAPIYGIVALSNTATDKTGRSLPAPGQGILTTASESVQAENPKLLDFNYRRLRLEKHLQSINHQENEIDNISESEIRKFQAMRRAAQDEWGTEFWKCDDSISPLCGALSVWGLDANDIGVISMHGTSTIANDTNESEVVNLQLKHLGRTPGNIVPIIAQKWLTGHPKGAAAAWMLNGMLQVLETGLVPGNRNADNIEEKLEQFEYLVYPSRSIQTPGIKAGLLKSFGFGQVGGELLIVHSDYILAVLSRDELEGYQAKVREREKIVYRYWNNVLVDNHSFVQVKDSPPYTKVQEQRVYLDSNARAKYDPKTKQYRF